MTHPEIAQLTQVPLFAGLSEEMLQTLATRMETEHYDAGAFPAKVGGHGYAFFVLGSGSAHAELDGKVLETLEPGSVFGEGALFAEDSRRTASVVADSPIEVYCMFGTDFRTMQMELPEVAERLQSLNEERLGRVNSANDV